MYTQQLEINRVGGELQISIQTKLPASDIPDRMREHYDQHGLYLDDLAWLHLTIDETTGELLTQHIGHISAK